MENQLVELEKVQAATAVEAFRWSRWADGNGCLFIVAGHYNYGGVPLRAKGVVLLNVDLENTIDVPMEEFRGWVESGSIKRVDTPILL